MTMYTTDRQQAEVRKGKQVPATLGMGASFGLDGQSPERGRPSMARAATLVAGVIVSGIAYLALAIAAPGGAMSIDMTAHTYPADGLYDPLAHASGMYPPEVGPGGITFRWTGPHATLTFPYASHLGRHTHVSVRLAAVWATEQNPAVVRLYLNDRPAGDYRVGPQFQEISAALDTWREPNPYLHPAHIQVDLRTTTAHVPGDPRELGVAVDRVELHARKSRTELAVEAATWVAVLCVVLWMALRRFSTLWAVVYAVVTALSLTFLSLTYVARAVPLPVEMALAGTAWFLSIWLAPRKASATARLMAMGLAIMGVWLVVAGRVMGDWQMDDAYISYRYAWNMVHGNGLVYNAGEVVEGYTNFLWTMLAAAVLWAGMHPVGVMLATNIGLAIGMLALTFHLGGRLWGTSSIWPMLAALLVATDGAVLAYGARGSGMEAMAFGFLVLLGVALLWSEGGASTMARRALGGAVLGLASLTRPEGLLAAAVFIAMRSWQDRVEGRDGRWGRMLGICVLPYLAVVLPYQAWRISYYGDLLPNTFYAKTGTAPALIARGWGYVSVFLGERWLPAGLSAFGIVVMALQRRLHGLRAALAAFVAIYSLYVVWVGGDHFPGWRFLVPVVVPLIVLGTDAARAGLSRLPRWSGARTYAAATLGLAWAAYSVSALALQAPDSVAAQLTRLHDSYVNRWGSAGLWLRDNTPPDTITAAKGAGAIAFYSQRRVIDVYGLNDLHIGRLQVSTMGTGNPGHDKQDPVYVLGRKPDYILDEWINYFQPVKGQLKQQYEYEVHRLPTGPELAWWHRK
jgi:hypothetical protein